MCSQRQMVTPNLKILEKFFRLSKSGTRGIDPSGPAFAETNIRDVSTARARLTW